MRDARARDACTCARVQESASMRNVRVRAKRAGLGMYASACACAAGPAAEKFLSAGDVAIAGLQRIGKKFFEKISRKCLTGSTRP